MKINTLSAAAMLSCFILGPLAAAEAQVNPSLMSAKKAAEAKGFIFETSHDEIVAKAKQEGRVKALTGLDPDVFPHMMASFKKKYPFLDVEMQEITGPDAAQRFILELKGGLVSQWDTASASTDFYTQYPPFAKKFDILGMAEQGILNINPRLVDPNQRTIVSLTTGISVPAYNKNLLPENKVPDKWEDFLKPEFKDRKFLVDIRPHVFAAFPACPEQGMGLEWSLNLARGLRDQSPIWFRGNTRAMRGIQTGEYQLHFASHYQSVKRAISRDPTGTLQLKIIEPVPVRMGNTELVLNSAPHPYAALLLLEHYASPEGQDIIDKYYPLIASVYTPGSHLGKLLKGKKLCVNAFENIEKSDKWMAQTVEAFGFPKAERKR